MQIWLPAAICEGTFHHMVQEQIVSKHHCFLHFKVLCAKGQEALVFHFFLSRLGVRFVYSDLCLYQCKAPLNSRQRLIWKTWDTFSKRLNPHHGFAPVVCSFSCMPAMLINSFRKKGASFYFKNEVSNTFVKRQNSVSTLKAGSDVQKVKRSRSWS